MLRITDNLLTCYCHLTDSSSTVRWLVCTLAKTCRLSVGQQLADSWLTVDRQRASRWPMDGQQTANSWLTDGQQMTNSCPLVGRLRVVPLSLSPSCMTREKTARKKWPREKRDYRLSPRVWIMRCSHNAKIWLAYVRSIDNVLSTFEIPVMPCRNVLETEQIKALKSRFASRDVLVNLPTGFGKI